MRLKPSALLGIIAIAPFVVGFTPSDEEGTYVSVSGGKGSFVSSPSGCSRPRLVEYTDQQAGVYHRWSPVDKVVGTKPGLGVDVNAFESREKECTASDCSNPGWTHNDIQFAVSPYATLDWRWAGLRLGGHVPLHPHRGGRMDHDITRAWLPIYLRGGARIGAYDRIYLSAELLDASPINSGGVFPVGVGGRIFGTDLWAGIERANPSSAVAARVGRAFGPWRISGSTAYAHSDVHYTDEDGSGQITEDFRVKIPEYSIAVGLEYRLP